MSLLLGQRAWQSWSPEYLKFSQRHLRRRWFESQHLTMKDWPQAGRGLRMSITTVVTASLTTGFLQVLKLLGNQISSILNACDPEWEGLCAGLASIWACTIRVVWMFTYFVYLYFYFLKVVDVQFSSYRVYAMFYCFPPSALGLVYLHMLQMRRCWCAPGIFSWVWFSITR